MFPSSSRSSFARKIHALLAVAALGALGAGCAIEPDEENVAPSEDALTQSKPYAKEDALARKIKAVVSGAAVYESATPPSAVRTFFGGTLPRDPFERGPSVIEVDGADVYVVENVEWSAEAQGPVLSRYFFDRKGACAARAVSVIYPQSNTLGATYWSVRIRDGARTLKGAEYSFK